MLGWIVASGVGFRPVGLSTVGASTLGEWGRSTEVSALVCEGPITFSFNQLLFLNLPAEVLF